MSCSLVYVSSVCGSSRCLLCRGATCSRCFLRCDASLTRLPTRRRPTDCCEEGGGEGEARRCTCGRGGVPGEPAGGQSGRDGLLCPRDGRIARITRIALVSPASPRPLREKQSCTLVTRDALYEKRHFFPHTPACDATYIVLSLHHHHGHDSVPALHPANTLHETSAS